MNNILMVAMLVFGLLAVSACNTVEGIGKDLEAAGETLQNTSKGE